MWTVAGSGGDDEGHRELEAAWRRRPRPEDEVPGSVAIDAGLPHGPEVGVFIPRPRLFRNSVDLSVELPASRRPTPGRGGLL